MKNLFLLLVAMVQVVMLRAQDAQFDKQGHRGCRGLMPENSIPAMKKALDLGATLEMDISFSKEKIAIVSHDQYILSSIALKPNADTLSKAEEKQLMLYQMPYHAIREYIYGRKPYPAFPQQQKVDTYVPKLEELIDSAETYAKQHHLRQPRYNIETKTSPEGDNILHPAPEEFVRLLMKVIREKHIASRTIIQSFDPRTLEIIHQQYPDMKTALLTSNLGVKQNLATLTFKPTIWSPNYKSVKEADVQLCHQKGIQIIPWTVNNPEEIQKLKAWGVDGIISDYPDRL
ncbi:glycerophosphodiester phosphodiesterase [Mucilaginibacter sp. RS28]|uniref:Glycerophosphodiester phosphodiesterase n=1 Tax=Mucilaginibacter straminoryzae TaxID=2932774 RepID=A0A9X1X6I0_9SPHI|nr:glycerophosphodiester phosphodiesterase family protein [Mucilaginibacter straminoryzae]MCJ8210568.1 glycerophosphodiester phosphodiesterase [Mucilaginibacter straminoryzae]